MSVGEPQRAVGRPRASPSPVSPPPPPQPPPPPGISRPSSANRAAARLDDDVSWSLARRRADGIPRRAICRVSVDPQQFVE
eukprot:2312302-Prymnesium_polylepis.1